MCTGSAEKWQTELKCLYKQRKDEIMKNSSKWKMWRATLDLRTCLICRKNHGKIYETDEFVSPFSPVHPTYDHYYTFIEIV